MVYQPPRSPMTFDSRENDIPIISKHANRIPWRNYSGNYKRALLVVHVFGNLHESHSSKTRTARSDSSETRKARFDSSDTRKVRFDSQGPV
ncbi:hypothetical protein DPMN_039544 [Dreissena polymorpha]|uniref:Uncharacterized protein n=1 Tax=Dreissena polymorpha TaxID=45954 RepID=A0A9D4HUC9_DREPO|nr:hypothetical protein DPMN_039544 [Dreissena polymorpha]